MTATNPSQLVAVKTMYGDRYHVRAVDLVGTRKLMRLHDPATGKPLQSNDDFSKGVHLHRGNICEHPEEQFTRFTALGDSWVMCPTCRARVDADAAALLAQAA